MSDQTIKLIELLKEGKTCNEICSVLNLSNKQLYSNLTNLKNKGFLFSRKYFTNGDIFYKSINSIKDIKDQNSYNQKSTITTYADENNIKFLVISDLHFGNELERIDLIEKAYNYCINNNIHIILCGGDLVDGLFSKVKQTITDPFLQVEHFIKNYPFDKSILTFAVAGDHDHSVLYGGFQDIVEISNNYRHDIVIGAYNNAIISIKNDSILLHHYFPAGNVFLGDFPIILHGHIHKYGITIREDNGLDITIPSLSDMHNSVPSALEMELEFSKGYIKFANIKQLYFSDNVIVLNESKFDLLKNRNVIYSPINNIVPKKINDNESSISKKLEKIKSRYDYQD